MSGDKEKEKMTGKKTNSVDIDIFNPIAPSDYTDLDLHCLHLKEFMSEYLGSSW